MMGRCLHTVMRHGRATWLTLSVLVMQGAWNTPAAQAHEVHEVVEQSAHQVVVNLTYADGEPFASEYFEVQADGAAKPLMTGRTDEQGRIVFQPDGAKQWRVRSFSADGHGMDITIDAQAPVAGQGVAAALARPAVQPLDRLLRLLLGLAVLAICFFGLWRYLRHRRLREA